MHDTIFLNLRLIIIEYSLSIPYISYNMTFLISSQQTIKNWYVVKILCKKKRTK